VFSTVLGKDALADFVVEDLKRHDVQCIPLIDESRPTTNKDAIIAENYRLLKVDTVDNRTINDKMVVKLSEAIKSIKADAVVFSDFRHGIFNRQTTPILTQAIPDGAFRVADSQVASRWGNILEFRGFDLITPNEREARFALGDQDSVVRPLALELHRRSQCKTLILKLGSRGLITYRSDSSEDYRAFFTIDSFADDVKDPVGAGDALLAYATLSMVVTDNAVVASILGALAAAVECAFDGNMPVTQKDVMEKIDDLERQAHYSV
jgi:bifunctional ADP-heptose synthase (sugar kinase/adenylyltransferase)